MFKKFLLLSLVILLSLTFSVSAADNDESYLGPYLGYRDFMNKRYYKDRPEFGIKFENYLKNEWNYELGAGLVFTKNINNENKKIFMYGLNLIYNFYNNSFLNSAVIPYIGFGLNGSYIRNDSKNGPDVAVGLKYKINENYLLKPEIKYINYFKHRDDLVISVNLSYIFKSSSAKVNQVSNQPQQIQKADIQTYYNKYKLQNIKTDDHGKITSVTLKINFETDKSDIQEEYYSEIENFANYLKDNPEIKVEIQGHTDNVGTAEYNQKLSESRADMVKKILIDKYNISADR
ncbi:MAG TPA: OmpA family protein, partial [bacterium]|nr:OmpA family protein [bacterium]